MMIKKNEFYKKRNRCMVDTLNLVLQLGRDVIAEIKKN